MPGGGRPGPVRRRSRGRRLVLVRGREATAAAAQSLVHDIRAIELPEDVTAYVPGETARRVDPAGAGCPEAVHSGEG